MYRAPAQRALVDRQRCLYCGAANYPGAECVPCRVLVPPAEGANLRPGPCARCPNPHLEATSLGSEDAVAFECRSCHSAFITAGAWTAIFDAVLAGQKLDLSHFAARSAPGQVDIFPLVRCSVCRYEMERARFGASTKLLIDVCNAHGVWLDPAELPVLVEIIGGAAEAGARDDIGAIPLDQVETYLLGELRAAEQELNDYLAIDHRTRRDSTAVSAEMMTLLSRVNAIRTQLDTRRMEKIGEREARRRLRG